MTIYTRTLGELNVQAGLYAWRDTIAHALRVPPELAESYLNTIDQKEIVTIITPEGTALRAAPWRRIIDLHMTHQKLTNNLIKLM